MQTLNLTIDGSYANYLKNNVAMNRLRGLRWAVPDHKYRKSETDGKRKLPPSLISNAADDSKENEHSTLPVDQKCVELYQRTKITNYPFLWLEAVVVRLFSVLALGPMWEKVHPTGISSTLDNDLINECFNKFKKASSKLREQKESLSSQRNDLRKLQKTLFEDPVRPNAYKFDGFPRKRELSGYGLSLVQWTGGRNHRWFGWHVSRMLSVQ
mmetsp:Transcript_146/g.340  ORF Transcript_146/g.340 Transcript_146/m.340 type:complete len:212 (-) Transcript_146:702-1337(-)